MTTRIDNAITALENAQRCATVRGETALVAKLNVIISSLQDLRVSNGHPAQLIEELNKLLTCYRLGKRN